MMISYLLLVFIHASLDFFIYFMLFPLVASLGFIIRPSVISCYLVVIMVGLRCNWPFDGYSHLLDLITPNLCL